MGETTAAVPTHHASSSVPFFAASKSSSTLSSRSSTGMPQLFSSSMQDFLVMPGRMEPVSIGVTTVPAILNITFMPPPSSTYFRCTPSSQRTCE